MPRRTHTDDPVVSLSRWQCTGVLIGLAAMAMLIFFAGVIVGKETTTAVPNAVMRIAQPGPGVPSGPSTPRERSRALSDIQPGTAAINADLKRPLEGIVPRDPTDAARIETHRQLSEARASGVAGLNGPSSGAPSGPSAHAVAAAPVEGRSDAPKGFTLQVSAFESRAPADIVSQELVTAGHPASVREVVAGQRRLYRVEVGQFDSADDAGRAQRIFERASGYSTVLVSTP